MARVERIEDIEGRHCSTCDATLTALAGRYDVLGRTDPVYMQDPKSLECPNGHPLPDELTAG